MPERRRREIAVCFIYWTYTRQSRNKTLTGSRFGKSCHLLQSVNFGTFEFCKKVGCGE